MEKSILLLTLMSLLSFKSVSALMNEYGKLIDFHVCMDAPWGGGGNPGEDGNGHPRGPILMPKVSIGGYILYIEGNHPVYEIYLVDTTDEEPDVVYQVQVPANVGIVWLPSTLSGTFELQLYDGGAYYFYSEIKL